MIFIPYLGTLSAWLDKILGSFKNVTVNGRDVTFTKHDDTTVTVTTQDTTYQNATSVTDGLMSAQDKAKLDAVSANANNYVHPTNPGNKHIPSGGSSGQILRWSADGTAEWGADSDTTYQKATQSADGLLSKEDKTVIDNLDSTYAKLTGSLATDSVTRTSPSGKTAQFISHGTDNSDEILDVGWDNNGPDGAVLGLRSAAHPTQSGHFHLTAANETNNSKLIGTPDGNLTWDNNTVLTTANGLPLSGGTLTGVLKTSVQTIMPITSDAIQGADNTGRISVCGGRQYLQGARALLYGIQNTSNPGEFVLECTDGNIIKTLRGKSDGTLTWGGDNIGVISAKNYGSSSGYTYFKSGLQICWGNNTNPSTASTGNDVTFPRAFKTVPSVFVTRRSMSTNTTPVSWMWPRETISTTGMNVYVPEFAGYYWLAIGQGAD